MYQASKEILHKTYHDITWRKSNLDRIALAIDESDTKVPDVSVHHRLNPPN